MSNRGTRIILKEKGKGKSTELLYTSEATGYRIICYTRKQCEYLKNMAKELDLKIPDPIDLKTYTDIFVKGYMTDSGILIDDLDACLDTILSTYFRTNVVAVTMTKNGE